MSPFDSSPRGGEEDMFSYFYFSLFTFSLFTLQYGLIEQVAHDGCGWCMPQVLAGEGCGNTAA